MPARVNEDLDRWFGSYRERGDRAALERIFRATAPALYRRALGSLRDSGMAEDAVQETFVALLRGTERFDAARSFRGYLFGTLDHRVHKARRGRGPARPLPSTGGAAAADTRSPESELSAGELRSLVRDALPQLPEKYREVLRLHLLEDLPASAIGARLRRPAPTVRVQLHRGLRSLRGLLPRGLACVLAIGLARARLRAERVGPRWMSAARRAAATAAVGAVVIGGVIRLAADPVTSVDRPSIASTTAETRVGAAAAEAAPGASASRAALPAPADGELTVKVIRRSDAAVFGNVGVLIDPAPGSDVDFHGVRGVTDEAGKLALGGLRAGPVRVCFDGGHLASVEVGARPEKLAVRLPAGTRVEGRVLSGDGAPIAGAAIWCNGDRYYWSGEHLLARTDGDGRFALGGLRAGARIGAFAEGHGASRPHVLRGRARDVAELRLRCRHGTLRGKVLDPAGRPVVGAVVRIGDRPRVRYVTPGNTDPERRLATRRMLTGSDGSFTALGLPPGSIDVLVRSRKHAARLRHVDVEDGVAHHVTIVVAPGRTVTGVVRGGDGAPLAGAVVLAIGAADHDWALARTGRSGRYRLEGVGVGDVQLVVSRPGHRQATQRLPVPVGDRTELDVRLARSRSWRGRLVDSAGRPRGGAGWQAWARSPAHRQPSATAVDAQGRFDLPHFEPKHAILARSPGMLVWLPCAVRIREGDVVEATLPAAADRDCEIVGTLRGFDSATLDDAAAEVTRDGVVYTPELRVEPLSAAFRIGPLPPGEYGLQWRGRAGLFPAADGGNVTLSSEAPTDVGAIEIDFGYLRYRARFADGGAPDIASFRVWLQQDGYELFLADIEGRLALRTGEYTLKTAGSTSMPTHRGVRVRSGEECDVEIVVQRAVLVQLRFRVAPGTASARAVLRDAHDRTLADAELRPLPDGSARLPTVLAPGRYRVDVHTGSGLLAGSFDLRSGHAPAEPVHVDLAPSGARRGTR